MIDRARRLVEILFGDAGARPSDVDDLFEISTGYVTLASNGYDSLDHAGLCFRRIDDVEFENAIDEIESFLSISVSATTERLEVHEDEYGYRWLVLADSDFEALVTAIQGAADVAIDRGYGTSLLCAVFAFQGDRESYLIYNFKRGKWYPFVPVDESIRDTDAETAIADLVEGELDLEHDESRQYALWGMPF